MASSQRAARRLRDLGRLEDSRHHIAGYNERLDGLQAAVLRIKLGHLDAWNATWTRTVILAECMAAIA